MDLNGAEPLHLPRILRCFQRISTAPMTPQSDIFLAVAATVPVFAGLAAHSTGFIIPIIVCFWAVSIWKGDSNYHKLS